MDTPTTETPALTPDERKLVADIMAAHSNCPDMTLAQAIAELREALAEEPLEERERLLSTLDERGRDLIERIMAQHPKLTAAKAIEHTTAFGGL